MKILEHIGRYFIMLSKIFGKFTKWNVLRPLIFKEIDILIIGSLGIVSFISFFVGGVVAIQTALNMENPFLPKNLIGFATRQSVILEFAPTFISVIMAGKVGSFIASSIGTMRVTEQIDALESLSFNPVAFLITPRIIAGILMFPYLVLVADIFGIIGGMVAGTASYEPLTTDLFFDGLRIYGHIEVDGLFGMFKGLFFGFAITSIACYKGFYAEGGAFGVGKATTSTVVLSCVSVVILDYILAALLL